MTGHAQTEEQPLWLNVAYTYTDFNYKETGVAEKGHASGVRGEFGFSLLRGLSVSAGGEYMDGNLGYDGETATGSSVNVINKDYVRDLRAMAHLAYGSFILSGGIAQRYWYDDVVGSYRRRIQYDYYPAMLTMQLQRLIYLRAEYDFWKQGKSTYQMADSGTPGVTDVGLKTSGGSGYGGELGFLLPASGGITTLLYVAYHHWEIKESDRQSDGIQTVSQPKNTLDTLQAGVGLDF
jgi:hypothetical protein